LIAIGHVCLETDYYYNGELMYDVFRSEKKPTVLTISSPLELNSTPSDNNNKHLRTSPADTAGTKQPADVTAVSPTVSEHHRIREPALPLHTDSVDYKLPASPPQRLHLPQYAQLISDSHTSPSCRSAPQQPVHSPHNDVGQSSQNVTGTSPNHIMSGSGELRHHSIHEPASPSFTTEENQLQNNSPQHHRHLPQYPKHISDSHIRPTYRNSDPQQPHVDISQSSQAIRGTSPSQMLPGSDEPQHHKIHEPTSPPFTSEVNKLPKNSPQHQHLPQYLKQVSDSHIRPTYGSTPQQPVFSPHDNVGQSSQAVRGTSPNHIMFGSDERRHHRIHESTSPPFTSSPPFTTVENQLPQRRHLPQYLQQISDSHSRLAPRSAPQQPMFSPHDNVDRSSQAVRGTSLNQMMSGSDETGHSKIVQRTAPIKPLIPPVEHQDKYRLALNQKHMPVNHQYTPPADQYRHRDPTSVSHGLDPYRQHIPPVTQPMLVLSTSNVGGKHNRTSSYLEQRPSAKTHRINSQRQMFAGGNEQGQHVERMLSFGNRPSHSRQNILTNDPYRLHYSPTDRANHPQRDGIGGGPVLSREHDLNMKNRQWTCSAENANDNASVRASGIPALNRHHPAANRPPQYSVPEYRSQQNSDLYRYPSPVNVGRVIPRPLPPAEHQPDDSRNPLIEPLQYVRSRQVCTESSVVSLVFCYSC